MAKATGGNMVYKAIEAVEAALAEQYSGPISERVGAGGQSFSYIPWTVTKRLLDTVFGVFGWTTSQPVVALADGVYTVTLALTVRVSDIETGETIEKTVPGIGQAVARGQGDDNAAKSALSDALSRAAKMLGDAFGFALYEKKGGPAAPRPATATSGDLGYRPSEKQAAVLRKNNVAYEGMPYSEWKPLLDEIFAKPRQTAAPF